MTPIQLAARDALFVQSACNLSGVVRSFATILLDVLWPEARRLGKGTEWVNRHPISLLFATQIAWLSCRGTISGNGDQGLDYWHASQWAELQKESETPIPFGPLENVA